MCRTSTFIGDKIKKAAGAAWLYTEGTMPTKSRNNPQEEYDEVGYTLGFDGHPDQTNENESPDVDFGDEPEEEPKEFSDAELGIENIDVDNVPTVFDDNELGEIGAGGQNEGSLS